MERNQVPAGWYDDRTTPNVLRWWDGTQWTAHTQPVPGQDAQSVSQAAQSASESASTESVPGTPGGMNGALARADESAATPTGSAARSVKVPVFGARKYAQNLQAQFDELGAADLVAIRQMTAEAQAVFEKQETAHRSELAAIEDKIAAARRELAVLSTQVLDVRTAATLQEFAMYDFEHPAEASVSLGNELASIRAQIKRAVSQKEATQATTNFTFNNSAAKGRRFVDQMSKMMLASYNAEAENAIKTVKAGNLDTAIQRLRKAAGRVEKNGTMIDLQITRHYQYLREQELTLAARHLQALQAEKEAERARRAELREQRQAEAELAREHQRLEDEKAKYLRALVGLRERGDAAGIAELEAKIADVEKGIEDIDYRKANMRAGFVYVISNVGSFGEDVVKIGMTRRLEPMDRVVELGDASVPFRFDIHALFFSDDAVALETALHEEFAERRMNRVNLRREFFYVSPQEVLDALKAHDAPVVEFTLEPAADEFRMSGGMTVSRLPQLPAPQIEPRHG